MSVLGANYRRLERSDARRRIRWITVGGIAGLAANLFFSFGLVGRLLVPIERLPSFWQGGAPQGRIGMLLTVVVPITIAYAVLKHRLFDVRVVLRRGLQYLFAKRALQALIAAPVIALAYTVVNAHDQTVAEITMGSTGYLYWIAALGISTVRRCCPSSTATRRIS